MRVSLQPMEKFGLKIIGLLILLVPSPMKHPTPSFNGFDFDIDHEGRGGWTSGQI